MPHIANISQCRAPSSAEHGRKHNADAAGNAFEFGVRSDAGNTTTRPVLFTTAWTAGNFG